jgi:hypothetical protein
MSKSGEEEGFWTFDINYKSDLHGFQCNNCSDPSQGLIPNGDNFKISFWIKSSESEIETKMVGGVFTIPLPLSKVSAFFEDKPEFVFYPYFFGTEGDFTVLEVESPNESLGKRQIVVYLPPGINLSVHVTLNVSVIM